MVCRRQSSSPVRASCAMMTHESGPPAGRQLRPEIALPRTRAVPGRCDLVVEDLCLPGNLPGRGIEPEHVVVVACVDDEPVVDRNVPVVASIAAYIVVDIVGEIATMRPLQIAGHGIDSLDDVARLRHIQDAVVGQRRPFLPPGRERSRPDHPELIHVLPGDLIQRAVAPTVERPTPHQPVVGRWTLQHRVRHWNELGGGLRVNRHRRQACRGGRDSHRDHPNRS